MLKNIVLSLNKHDMVFMSEGFSLEMLQTFESIYYYLQDEFASVLKLKIKTPWNFCWS